MNSVSLRDVIQRRQTSGGCQLNIYCQIQNQNQEQCTSTISSHSPCIIPLTCNGQTTHCRGSVCDIQPNCREYKCISGGSFLKTD